MHFKTLLLGLASISVAAVLSGPVQANDLRWNFGLGYTENDSANTSLTELYGQVYYEWPGGFGLQGDLTLNDYSFDSDTRLSFGLHATYRLNDELLAGAYFGQQDWFGADYDYYGIELSYESPQFQADGHIGRFEANSGSFERTLYGVDTEIPLTLQQASSWQQFGILTGFHGITDGTDETLVYLGATTEFRNNIHLDLTWSRVDSENQIGFMLRIDGDDGYDAPFHRRGWTAAFRSW